MGMVRYEDAVGGIDQVEGCDRHQFIQRHLDRRDQMTGVQRTR